jgi:hypothetical protein
VTLAFVLRVPILPIAVDRDVGFEVGFESGDALHAYRKLSYSFRLRMTGWQP